MLVNADFARAVVIVPHQYDWAASPQPGVERVMLDRIGAEQARATSIVRYAPESSFPPHAHPGGEEILVLSGTFSDETGDYPEGWYLRSPPGSAHRPSSREGALIFVKLRQMAAGETEPVRIDTRDSAAWRLQQDGRAACPLFSGEREQACLQRVAPNAAIFNDPIDGAELLVLEGELVFEGQGCARGSWIRLPPGVYPALAAGQQGATFYLKTGHLSGGMENQ
jgi:anti-sigma factor ChrR (cupin superfamily)